MLLRRPALNRARPTARRRDEKHGEDAWCRQIGADQAHNRQTLPQTTPHCPDRDPVHRPAPHYPGSDPPGLRQPCWSATFQRRRARRGAGAARARATARSLTHRAPPRRAHPPEHGVRRVGEPGVAAVRTPNMPLALALSHDDQRCRLRRPGRSGSPRPGPPQTCRQRVGLSPSLDCPARADDAQVETMPSADEVQDRIADAFGETDTLA